jgi:hypothetical protein
MESRGPPIGSGPRELATPWFSVSSVAHMPQETPRSLGRLDLRRERRDLGVLRRGCATEDTEIAYDERN